MSPTADAPGTAPPPDPALSLAEVLEQEYAEITGEAPDPPPPWTFTPAQILSPESLQRRLTEGQDRASRSFGSRELKGLTDELTSPAQTARREDLRRLLAARLNELLDDRGLFHDRPADELAGVEFRCETRDRLTSDNILERNRLLLEDAFPEVQKVHDIRLANIYRKFHEKKLAALCLSGGGIRSATFGLGVVQGLARNRLLDKFHYLSTVSGGGFIGGWLSAWISRTGIEHVMRALRRPTRRPLDPEPGPISHLRRYSNYLSPRLGLLSADTWTLVATYLRNLFLNWLVFIPPLLAVLLLPLVLLAAIVWRPQGTALVVQFVLGAILLVTGLWGGVKTVAYVHRHRPEPEGETEGTGLIDTRRNQDRFLRECLVPLVAAVLATTILWAWTWGWVRQFGFRLTGFDPEVGLPLVFAAAGALVHWVGWLRSGRRTHRGEGLFIAVTGLIAGLLSWIIARRMPADFGHDGLGGELYVWLAVPVLLVIILVFGHIHVGFTSGRQVDASREWSARYSAWILIVVTAWLFGTGIILLGPVALRALADALGNRSPALLATAKTVLGIVGTISGLFTLRAAHGEKTAATEETRSAPVTLALKLAAPTFVLVLFVALAWAGQELVLLAERPAAAVRQALGLAPALLPFRHHTDPTLPVSIVVAIVLFGFGLVAARRIDINKFSLHAVYRARLIRAYLGASREPGERDPNKFTGFDDGDNLPLRDLWHPRSSSHTGKSHNGPLHVINVTLNLVGGDNLAWQQRKAESFTMSPLHCGSRRHGYRPTRRPSVTSKLPCYGGRRGVSLGTAITISGAAASPNMGYHSSGVLSMLLALFNVRLGWWLANPGYAGRKVYQRSAPESSLRLVVDEALGRTDARHDWVYLSDGGHFENLGLYEMVLRRCHTIVLSDAGCDPDCAFVDLGNAIRKIRVDLGIPIAFRTIPIYSRRRNGDAPEPRAYAAVGTIGYSAVDPDAEDGTLIYIKPAFYGLEPTDIFNYGTTVAEFPHESTADQFFSESQFESYRALGAYVIDRILPPEPRPARAAVDSEDRESLAWLVRRVLDGDLPAMEPGRPAAAERTRDPGAAAPAATELRLPLVEPVPPFQGPPR